MSPLTPPIVGIDLGTTNSLVAVAGWPESSAAPRVLATATGATLVPSVVRFDSSGVVIGSDARAEALTHPQSTISSVKRLMGRSAADAASDIAQLPYDVVEGEQNTARIRLPDGRIITPQEVSAHILRALRAQASAALGVEITKAVITVPAYFDDAQRQATRDAARLAGLEAVRLVNEPTAAALAYGLGISRPPGAPDQTIMVYDLGGGTFDVSVLRLARSDGAVGADCFQVLATAGDTRLGGDDFDHALVALFGGEILRQFGIDVRRADSGTRAALQRFAESVKIRLSTNEDSGVRIDLGGGRIYERTVLRREFEDLIRPMIDRTILCCRRALRDADIPVDTAHEALSSVVMVGGSTRIPLVRSLVGEFLGIEPYTALNPDTVVALGAGVQASVLAGAARGTLLLDVLPLSLGIETVGGAAAKLIMRNSTVPARASEMFSTSVDNQTGIRVNIVQGERELAADCRSLGTFELGGLPPMPAGIPKVRITFMIDANGILSVSAVEERSGKRSTLQIVPNHGLSRDEVARIERESFAHAREDFAHHRIIDLVANARLDLNWIGKQMQRLAGRLPESVRAGIQNAAQHVTTLIASAESDWRTVNADDFHRAKEHLDRASIPLHELSITESLRGMDGSLPEPAPSAAAPPLSKATDRT